MIPYLDPRILASIFGATLALATLRPLSPQSAAQEASTAAPISPALKGGLRGYEAPPDPPPAAPSAEPHPGCGLPRGLGGVHLFSGEFHRTEVDLVIPGRGLDFVWARTYRSRLGPDTDQGRGWDFSYNVWIELAPGGGVLVHDGGSRADLYEEQPDGTYTAEQLFREGAFDASGQVFTLTFADTGFWEFRPLDDGTAPGKLARIVDRNGNQLVLGYAPGGQLGAVVDTLGRAITIERVAGGPNAGRIASITDFTGRQVVYSYYEDGEPGGSTGDLESARSPVVTGTVTGNDFPDGKTTTYTYSTGFADERLNHNLLTVTDPKGQTFLSNEYAGERRPGALLFDRLVRQTLGNQGTGPEGDHVDLTYAPVAPLPKNHGAWFRTTVNDRVGNVSRHFFDLRNRCVAVEQLTGRADPDLPTAENDNPPVGPLRPDDPAAFVTRWEWNADSRPTRIFHPNGNETLLVYELELDPGAPWRSRGNLRERHRLPGTHTPPGDQRELVELFEYDEGFGACCGSNFVTRHVDPRGNETLHTYDDDGNRVHTQHRIPSIVEDFAYNAFGQLVQHTLPDNGSGHRRVDTFAYYDSGPQAGYLREAVVDDGGFHLATSYEYDAVGNLVRTVDPRGNDTLYEVNALDQIVRETSREIALPGGGTTRYERDLYYDANGNVVRVDVQNLDEDGAVPGGNGRYTTVYEYEILNHLVRECEEAGEYTGPVPVPGPAVLPACGDLPAQHFVTTEYEYDANRNLVRTRYGEAVEGRQPDNVVATLYDERDLVFQTIRGFGGGEESTAQLDYDRNGNVRRERTGQEDGEHVTEYVYDGYDRLVERTDPMGNFTSYHYDANGNRGGFAEEGVTPNPFASRVDGELEDLPGSVANVRLYEETASYDPMDRQVSRSVAFFDPQTQAAPSSHPDGASTTITAWTDHSGVASRTDDRGNTTTYAYDTANRISSTTDHVGNVRTYGYDDNSNVVALDEEDKSTGDGSTELFTTTWTYDALDRQSSHVDPGTHVTEYLYDSRGNRTTVIDPRGNETRYSYDGLSRLVGTEYELRDGGGAPGLVVDTVETAQAWDDTSRLVSRTDDEGNATSYDYDGLNRRIRIEYADCTQDEVTYDAHDNRVSATDANGSVMTSSYDDLDRLIVKAIVPSVAEGVSDDTTIEIFGYDGLSRVVLAFDDDSTVLREHDSLSNVTRETLNGQVTLREYDGMGNEVRCTYPGGRVVERTFDGLNRVDVVAEPASALAGARGGSPCDSATPTTIADVDFIGCRPDKCCYPICEFDAKEALLGATEDTIVAEYEYDADRRVTRTTQRLQSSGAILDDRSYVWDAEHNKTRREELFFGDYTVDYEYDSLDRLVRSVTEENWTGTGVMIDRSYVLDGVHNWEQVTGGSCAGDFTMDGNRCAEPADEAMNQYTTTPCDARTYDRNGNLDAIDPALSTERDFTWDYRNRLVSYSDAASGVDATYAYDAFGRRIEKTVDDGTPETTLFLYRDWQVLEEQDGANATQATYVYGPYVDQPLTMDRDVDGDGTPERYRYVWDDNYNVVGLTLGSELVESYEYRDYGEPLIWDYGVGGVVPSSSRDNRYLFTGRRRDVESGLYQYRRRYFDPCGGRFVSRDPVGTWGDDANLGNAFTYVASQPLSNRDPMGAFPGGNPLKPILDGYGTLGDALNALEAADSATRLRFALEMRNIAADAMSNGDWDRYSWAACAGRKAMSGGDLSSCGGPFGACQSDHCGIGIHSHEGIWGWHPDGSVACSRPDARPVVGGGCWIPHNWGTCSGGHHPLL